MTQSSYSHHHNGDSLYGHTGDKVAFGVLGTAVILTLAFSAIELVVGMWANSLALIGDAGHMVTDSASLLFALLANFFSRKGADDDHSFGHGRIEVMAAFINGLLMLVVVAAICREAIGRLSEPQAVQGGLVMIVAVIGLVINVGVAFALSKDKKNMNTKAALVHVMGDLLGSVAAIAAGALIHFGGESFQIFDPILSMLVCLLLLHATWEILRDSTRILLDGVPEGVKYRDVGDAISAIEGVEEVHDLHIWSMAPAHAACTVHVHLKKDAQFQTVLLTIRTLLKERFGIDHVTVQPERD